MNTSIFENELLAVDSASVGYGIFCINELGYAELDLPENMNTSNYLILSGHCPSKMEVSLKKHAGIKGIMNGTSNWLPTASCMFFVSDNIVGYLFGPKDTTREMILEPGDYTLETTSLDPGWKHSLWAICAIENEEASS